MSSSFDSLPPEVAQRCVEFLPFAEVHAEIKQVSKATRKVARRALTRGRWKPIRFVAEQGLAVCAAEDRAWPVEGLRGQQTYTDPPPAAACAIFREAWAIDPALVIRTICGWDAESLRSGYDILSLQNPIVQHTVGMVQGIYHGRFLWIVEPSESGLSRIVSASEDTYFEQSDLGPAQGGKWAFFAIPLLNIWWKAVRTSDRALTHIDVASFFSRGLEAWSDPLLAARFTREYLWRFGYGDDLDMHEATPHLWAGSWEDQRKARAYVAEMERIREEISEMLEEQLAAAEWEVQGGSADDYLDFISGGDY